MQLSATELDESALRGFETMKPEDADAAMERFCEANLSRITNKTSFLNGIIRRIQEEGSTDLIQALDTLARPVRNRLQASPDPPSAHPASAHPASAHPTSACPGSAPSKLASLAFK